MRQGGVDESNYISMRVRLSETRSVFSLDFCLKMSYESRFFLCVGLVFIQDDCSLPQVVLLHQIGASYTCWLSATPL